MTKTTTRQAVASSATADHIVPVPPTLRAKRIVAVQVALHAKRIAAKAAAAHAIATAAKQQAYMVAVQQLAAEYGVPVPNTLSARAARTQQTNAPSAVANPCAVIAALYTQHNGVRAAVLAAAKEQGINPYTAATQYAKQRKLHQTH